MKTLFAGWHNPHFICMSEFIERALLRMGHEVKFFENRQFMIPGRIRDRIPILDVFDKRRINRKLIATANAFRPDVLFVLQGDTLLPETIRTIRETLGIPAVNWFIDPSPYIHALSLKLAPAYDLCFAGNSTMVKENLAYGNTTMRLLRYACDPEIHCPVPVTDEERRHYGNDVVFMGSWYPERESLLETLDEFDLGIWGAGWEKLHRNSPLRKRLRGGQLQPTEWRKIYSSAKIVLNIHYGFNSPDKRYVSQAANRVFEILGCGAFELTDDTPDVRAVFEDGKHLATYSTVEELKEKLRLYLNDPLQREAIARAGRNEVLAKHTYDHRMREILSLIRRTR
jgi:spore maturation protein CgeB